MANKVMCDICEKREASRQFKIKKREACRFLGIKRNWSDWKKIDICGECGEKLLGLPYRDSDGFRWKLLPTKRNVKEVAIMPNSSGDAPEPEYKIPAPAQRGNEEPENG